jgi:putative DNA-invertase from lambdoid prophage Rac
MPPRIVSLKRQRIKERCDAGRDAARASLLSTGKTHKGKVSLGRPKAADAAELARWRKENSATIPQTMTRFGISKATVARYCSA